MRYYYYTLTIYSFTSSFHIHHICYIYRSVKYSFANKLYYYSHGYDIHFPFPIGYGPRH